MKSFTTRSKPVQCRNQPDAAILRTFGFFKFFRGRARSTFSHRTSDGAPSSAIVAHSGSPSRTTRAMSRWSSASRCSLPRRSQPRPPEVRLRNRRIPNRVPAQPHCPSSMRSAPKRECGPLRSTHLLPLGCEIVAGQSGRFRLCFGRGECFA